MRGPATGSLFSPLLDRLDREGVAYALLRDRDPHDPALAELDLLVWPRSRGRFARLAREAGFVPCRRRIPRKEVFAAYAQGKVRSLDVHYALVQGGLVYLPLPDPATLPKEPHPHLAAEDELLHLFFHSLLGKGGVQAKHMERVRALATAVDRARLRARAGKAWREVEPLLGAPETYAEGGPGAAAAAGRLRAALRRNPANLARELYVRFLLDRVRRPRGTMVAFLGVDGAGKTTTVGLLAAKLEAARVPFAKAYFGPWGQFQTRLLAWAYRKGLTPPEEDWLARLRTGPGRLRALAKWLKGSVRALAYYAALSWDLLQRYRKDARPQLKRGGLVLVDRYPYDARHLYDGRPVTALPLARRLLCALFPKPHLLFFLFDDPEAIVARKPQLTVEQARAQQEVYRRTLAGRGAIEVRTNRPAAEIAEELATRILARYHERR